MIEYEEKDQKYVVRKTLCSDRKHDYDFIESFVKALEANGFSSFQAAVPLNANSKDRHMSIEEFFSMNKRYLSQIVIGENLDTGDSVKAILVDIKSKSSFDDKDFTNGYGSSEVLIRSSNPIRAYYLVRQLQLFTEKEGRKRFFSRWWVGLIIIAVLVFSFLFLLKSVSTDSIHQSSSGNTALSIVLFVICLVISIASIVDSQKALCIERKDKKSFKLLLSHLIRGDYKDNLFSRIAFFTFGTFVGTVIDRLMKK